MTCFSWTILSTFAFDAVLMNVANRSGNPGFWFNLATLSACRMLLAFSEQTKGQKFPENPSDEEMMEIVMGRWILLFCWFRCYDTAPVDCKNMHPTRINLLEFTIMQKALCHSLLRLKLLLFDFSSTFHGGHSSASSTSTKAGPYNLYCYYGFFSIFFYFLNFISVVQLFYRGTNKKWWDYTRICIVQRVLTIILSDIITMDRGRPRYKCPQSFPKFWKCQFKFSKVFMYFTYRPQKI